MKNLTLVVAIVILFGGAISLSAQGSENQDESLVKFVMKQLPYESRGVRERCIAKIIRMGHDAVPTIASGFYSSDPKVRYWSLRCARELVKRRGGAWGDQVEMGTLQSLLEDHNPNIRCEAAKVLGEITEEGWTVDPDSALRLARADPNLKVSQLADEMLQRRELARQARRANEERVIGFIAIGILVLLGCGGVIGLILRASARKPKRGDDGDNGRHPEDISPPPQGDRMPGPDISPNDELNLAEQYIAEKRAGTPHP